MIKEHFVGPAEVIAPLSVFFPDPAAASPAKLKIPAASAFPVLVPGQFHELHRLFFCGKTPKLLFPYIAQLPMVQHIEVTGLYASATLHHMLDTALSPHVTCLGRIPLKHAQIVIKVADGYQVSMAVIIIPQIEQFTEKTPVFLG